LRGDLIEVFKILKGYENIDQEVFFDVTVQPKMMQKIGICAPSHNFVGLYLRN